MRSILAILFAFVLGFASPVWANEANITPLEQRINLERDTAFSMLPHRPNYLMPVSYATRPHNEPYTGVFEEGTLNKNEIKFQLSIKFLVAKEVFIDNLNLEFAFTTQSYWQAYNKEYSSPFRETNYEPEAMFAYPLKFKLMGFENHLLRVGFSHQSNGRSNQLSRSWNRVYVEFLMARNRWAVSFKPWYRIPETAKTSPTDPSGDDNPDIEHYLGHFELGAVYKWGEQNLGILIRNNLRHENRGAVSLLWSVPIRNKITGLINIFNGYGDSLIEYNHSNTRISFGIALNTWL